MLGLMCPGRTSKIPQTWSKYTPCSFAAGAPGVDQGEIKDLAQWVRYRWFGSDLCEEEVVWL